MGAEVFFRRSPEGQQALDSRDKRISARLRALMLMAEGKPMSRFAETAAALGAPTDALEQLVLHHADQYLWGYARYKQPRSD